MMVTVRPSSSIRARAFATRPSAILALHLACPVCAASASIPAMRAPSHTPAGRCHHLCLADAPLARRRGGNPNERGAACRKAEDRHRHVTHLYRLLPRTRSSDRPSSATPTIMAAALSCVRLDGRSDGGGASAQSKTNPSRGMNRRHCRRHHCRVLHRFRLLGRMTWDGRSPAKPSPCGLFPRPRPPHAACRVGWARAPRGRYALK